MKIIKLSAWDGKEKVDQGVVIFDTELFAKAVTGNMNGIE
jgi:hypothetical protein